MYTESFAQVQFIKHGESVTVIHPTNIYGATVGNNVFIGPFCEIQSETFIGDRCKIQSHTFICSLVTIGSDCFIGHGVVFVNDTFSIGRPAGGKKELYKKTNVGDFVSIGSNSTILPVTITSRVVIGAGSVVTRDLAYPGIYAGNPAKKIRDIDEKS
jgi:acetyltransferase-like isoleucine patch superfamily enzyme